MLLNLPAHLHALEGAGAKPSIHSPWHSFQLLHASWNFVGSTLQDDVQSPDHLSSLSRKAG